MARRVNEPSSESPKAATKSLSRQWLTKFFPLGPEANAASLSAWRSDWVTAWATAIAFMVAAAHWPGFAAPHLAAGWILLSAALPLALMRLWQVPAVTTVAGPARMFAWPGLHWRKIGAPFLVFAWAGALWSPAPGTTLMEAWHWTLLGCAFALGASLPSIRAPLSSFAAAIAISGFLALMQSTGWVAMRTLDGYPAGLFVNKNYMAEAAAAALAACLALASHDKRAWLLVPGLVLALGLGQSRTALAATGVCGCFWLLRRQKWAALAVAAAIAAALVPSVPRIAVDTTVQQRLEMWELAARALTFWGHGAGSYWAMFPLIGSEAGLAIWNFRQQPHHPHNEILALAFELGFMALLPLSILLSALCRGFAKGAEDEAAFLALLAVAVVALGAFPFRNPATGFVAALCAGYLCRPRPVPGGVAGLGRGRIQARA